MKAYSNYQLVLHGFYMQVHHDISRLPLFHRAVLTIGTFDGVHSGHRQILRLMQTEKDRVKGETVILTFDPHPRQLLGTTPGPLFLLNTPEEKIRLLQAQGIDHLVVIPFTPEFAALPATQYIEEFLVKHFHPHTIIIGYDHRFGQNRAGDFRLLEAEAGRLGYQVREIPGFMLEDVTISSTRIREALLQGEVQTANRFLGYPYFFSGTVVKGNQLGRTLGYPTANLESGSPAKLLPGNGVYAVNVFLEKSGEKFRGMMNIGMRPTVDGSRRVTEVHLFDFDRDIYGESLRIEALHHLRQEQKFNGLEALKEQLALDKAAALAFFGQS